VRRIHHFLVALEDGRFESQLAHVHLEAGRIQDPHHDLLSVGRGDGRDPQIDLASLHRQFDAAILRQPSFGDVHLGHHLQA